MHDACFWVDGGTEAAVQLPRRAVGLRPMVVCAEVRIWFLCFVRIVGRRLSTLLELEFGFNTCAWAPNSVVYTS